MTDQLTAVGPAGRYRLERRLATGGMGVVWEATDTLLDREVAVKILKSEYADDATFRSRFEAEARHAAALHHPHVASVFDFGELPAGDGSDESCPFLVMELVPGRPLSELLRDGTPMDPVVAADLVAQAAEAIAAAHALGIVHRDVKPGNLLVDPGGGVKITDFGIARAADAVALTQTGQIVGTPHYISPEQAAGRSATEASDVYALGVVLYECLAGRRPFAGDTPVTIALAHLREAAPPLSDDVPLHLRQVVAKALAKDPADRFAGAGELAAALRGEEIAGGLPADPDTRPFTAAGLSGDASDAGRPPWLPLAAAGAGALLLFGTLALGTGQPAEPVQADDTAVPSVAEPVASPEPVRVRRSDLVGRDADRVTKRLEAMGLEVTEEPQANPGGHRPGTVAAVTPYGLVEPSTTVTLFVWEKPPERERSSGPDPSPTTSNESRGGKADRGPSDRGIEKSNGKAGNGKGKKR